jgi:hypothetical protein
MYMWIGVRGPARILKDIGVETKYNGQCHACLDLLTTHRDTAVDYLRANREKVLVEGIILDDSTKRIAQSMMGQIQAKGDAEPQEIVAYKEG